ncbi:MAG: YciI family protein [Synechococcus sp.]
MPWFIKTEHFTSETVALPHEQRRPYLEAHRQWVEQQVQAGRSVRSGFLVDEERRPGGGGLLLFEAESYAEARAWVLNDPMIRAGLVRWQLQEWIPVSGDGWP